MIQIGNVTINRGIEHTSVFWAERINQRTQTSSTGKRFNYDNSRTILRGVIEIRYVEKSEADALRKFLTDTIRFGKSSFNITPEPYDDLGGGVVDGSAAGDGKVIENAFFDGSTTTEGIIKPIGKAYKFNITFPYYKVIIPVAGVADHDGVVS